MIYGSNVSHTQNGMVLVGIIGYCVGCRQKLGIEYDAASQLFGLRLGKAGWHGGFKDHRTLRLPYGG